MKKDFLKLLDYSGDELIELLDLADRLKAEQRQGKAHPLLAGKTLGMIFQKASTRTRVSFEVGIYQLGGQGLFLSSADLQIGRGELVEDTARVLTRYLDGIMIRTFAQQEVETIAQYATVPVINGLTDFCHPCQVMADLQTIREFKGSFDGLKAAYIGDGNNMANSLIVGCLKAGIAVAAATPDDYRPSPVVLDFAKEMTDKGASFTLTNDPAAAAVHADVLITDVWASMGQEAEAQKRAKAFEGYQINDSLTALANKDALVLHCLPAHRGEEITAEVFEAHAKEIFEEAENRLHAQKAIMARLMGGV